MSEQTLPPTTTLASRDIPTMLWHVLVSPKMSSLLLISLAVLALLSLFFSPQQPTIYTTAGEQAQWTSAMQSRFGSWYDILLAWGLFDIGASVGLRLVLAVSALSLAVGLVDGALQVSSAWRQTDIPPPEYFTKMASSSNSWHTSQERAELMESLAQRLAWPVRSPWRRLQIWPWRTEVNRIDYLYQNLSTWRQAASLVIRLGLLLIMSGAILNARLGWRQEGVMLVPGQTVSLTRFPDLSLRLEGVAGEMGQAASQIALDYPDGSSRAGTASFGHPYTIRGATIYQRDVRPLLRVSAWGAAGDGAGAPISVEDASTEMEPADEVRLIFTESRLEQYLLMPYIQKTMRLVLYRQGKEWDANHDELQIEIYAGNYDTPEARASLVGSGRVKIGDIIYEFNWEQYALLDIVGSIYQWPVRMGMGLALLGLITTLLIPPLCLLVRVTQEVDYCAVGLFGEILDEPVLLDIQLAEWRRRLEEGGTDG